MKKIFVLAACAFVLASCAFTFGNGVNVIGYSEEGGDFTEERSVGIFDEFKAEGPFNTYFVQSDTYKVVIDGKEEFVQKVITELKDNDLTIKLEKGTYKDLILKVTVYAPDIEEACTAGSGNLIDKEGHVSTKDIDYRTAGSGDLILANIQVKDLDVATAGSGNIYIDGATCEDLEIRSSGSGDSTLKDVKVKGDFEYSSAGSGDLKTENLIVNGDVNAKTSGSGDLNLNGKCHDLNVKSSGSGDIRGNFEYNKLSSSISGSGKINL